MAFDDNNRELSIGELENANTDRSVNPAVMVRGMAGRDENGVWRFISLSSANSRLLVSGTFTTTSSPLSADSSSISAKQGDAGLLRVSAIGGTTGDNTLVDGTTQTISATLTPVSAIPGSTIQGLVINANLTNANQFHVSSVQSDAGLQRVSSINDSGSVSAKSSDAGTMRVSAVNSVSSLSPDAGLFHISGFSPDAALFRVSGILAAGVSSVGAASFGVSAAQIDAGVLHVSAFQGDANNLHTSSVQGDAGLFRASSWFGVDTTGQWTIGRLSNLSSSGNIKATAGTIYGYYAYNSDKIPNYINFTNTSGAINVGTDDVQLKIMLPPSAAANVGFPGGLKGFTNGIGVYATSSILDGATTPAATSAVGINVFYN